ncbi:MAG: CHAT domain-containing protein [Ilumatobacteraceae bacterium]
MGTGVRNLQISFEHLEGREYQVTAALDDGETVTSAFTLPVDDVGLAEVLRDLGAALGHRPAALPEPGHDRPRRRGRARHRPTAEQFGTTLADALLAGPVGELFDRAERDSGVQLRLAFVPDQLELLKIPWEFLCHRGVFVAMQPRTPVLRELWTGDADSEPPTPGRRIRVLAIAASPEGHDPLETARELEQLALIASEHPDDVTLTTIEDCTFDQLRRALDDDHDVLHFIGHSFCDDHGEAGLVLCRDDRSPHQLSAMAFANLVGKSRTLDLVVLNSCESFRVVDGQPYASLAAKLVRVGRSAVIAMQFKISDDAAIKFSEELYHRIVVDRYGIDRAVAEACMAVMGVNEMEFATPVLYLRDGNTELFRPMTEAGPEDRPVVAPAVVERAPDHFVPSDESEFGNRPLSLQEPNLVGDDVVELQNRLVALGFEPGRVDGVYGPFTTEAIRRFQEHAQLTVVEPGACDRVTFDAIERELAASPVTEPVTGDLPRPGTVPNARKRRAMAGGVLVVGVAGILATNWPGGGSGPPSGSTTTAGSIRGADRGRDQSVQPVQHRRDGDHRRPVHRLDGASDRLVEHRRLHGADLRLGTGRRSDPRQRLRGCQRPVPDQLARPASARGSGRGDPGRRPGLLTGQLDGPERHDRRRWSRDRRSRAAGHPRVGVGTGGRLH